MIDVPSPREDDIDLDGLIDPRTQPGYDRIVKKIAEAQARNRPEVVRQLTERMLKEEDAASAPSICPACHHPIPPAALAAINEKIERGERAECDDCPY